MRHHNRPRPHRDGRAYDLIDVANHLAQWLEPRRIEPSAALALQTLAQHLADTAGETDQHRLEPAARAWQI